MTHQQHCVQKFQLGPLGLRAVPTVTVKKKQKLWLLWEWPLTYLSGLMSFRLGIGRPSCAPDVLHCLLFLTLHPCLSSVEKHPLPMNQFVAWLPTLYLSYVKYFITTEKENPYEDVDLKRKSLGRKSLSESSRSWTTVERKLNSPPQVGCKALRINRTVVL